MATVTGNYVTSANQPLPAGAVPRIEAVPSKNAVSVNGQVISLEPQTVTPDPATGAFTFDLIPTVEVIDRDFHYQLRGYYLDGNVYGSSGLARVELFAVKLRVPTEGGSVDELVQGVTAPQALTIVSLTEPPIIIPGVWWLDADPNGNPDLGTGDYYEGVA